MIKQVIVMRKDLNMRKGKIAAQAAHASMKVLLDKMNILVWGEGFEDCANNDIDRILSLDKTNESDMEINEWLEGLFTKICVSVDSEEELLELYNKALDANIPCAIIKDSGLTEFNGVPTNTCIAIGPASSEKIDKITGDLKLL